MSEIALKVDGVRDRRGVLQPDPADQDGDILVAVNDKHIKCRHTVVLCDYCQNVPNSAGWVDDGVSLSQEWYERTAEWKFVRVSHTELRRINRLKGTDDVIGPEHIDLPLYLKRRKAARRGPNNTTKRAIFGTEGAEVWYEGTTTITEPILDQIWDRIEADTPARRAQPQYQVFPWSPVEMAHHLVIPVEDFDDEVGSDLTVADTVLLDEEEVDVRNHARDVAWRAIAGLDPGKVLDKSLRIDVRDSLPVVPVQNIRRAKPSLKESELNEILDRIHPGPRPTPVPVLRPLRQ